MFCSICQDEIKDEYIHTQCCKQNFHRECLLKWLIQSSMCPLCRLYLDPKEIADDPDDLPIYVDDAFWWYKDDQLHRENGPAYIDDKGNEEWYYHGRLHRLDGPAGIYVDGCKQWWNNGLLHRVEGPAVECEGGHCEWWLNGQRHRVDGPAVIIPGKVREWWCFNKLHRPDGPAVIHSDGREEIWINGVNQRHRPSTVFGMLFNMLK